jgi:PAS domain S-box-containing protein
MTRTRQIPTIRPIAALTELLSQLDLLRDEAEDRRVGSTLAAALAGTEAAELAEALERVAFPAYVTDAQGRVLGQNDASIEFTGDVRGRFVDSTAVPVDRPKIRHAVARKLMGGEATVLRVNVARADGEVRRIEVSSVPLRRHGRVVGLFGLYRPVDIPAPKEQTDKRLTPREHEVLTYLAAGCSTEQMAEMMGLSQATVRNHVKRLLRALGVHSRLEAVAAGHRLELIDLT